MSDDPELDKIAELRAADWGCTRAEARERLLREAADERVSQDYYPGSERLPVPLDKLAELRAEQWDCTPAQARERLLQEAADERALLSEQPPESLNTALFAGAAFAAITAIEGGLWDRYLLRIQAVIRARLASDEYGQSRRRSWKHQ